MNKQILVSKSRWPFFVILLLFTTAFTAIGGIIPSGGEYLSSGQSVLISWKDWPLNERVSIELWDGQSHKYQIIVNSVVSRTNEYQWIVPAGLSGDLFRIRIISESNALKMDLSDTYFTIDPIPKNGGNSVSVSQIPGVFEVHCMPPVACELLLVNFNDYSPSTVDLVDLNGTIVLSQVLNIEGEGSCVFLVSKLMRGVYFVHAKYHENINAVVKIVIL